MDSNASKKGFLHKFFKLGFKNEKMSLSVKELLLQTLLSTINLAQQSFDFALDTQFLASTIGSKIVLLDSYIETISSNRQTDRVLSKSQPKIIVYSSSIALLLASKTKVNSKIIAEKLVDLLILQGDDLDSQANLNLFLEVNKSGLINLYLDQTSIAIWLEKSLALLNTKTAITAQDNSFLPELAEVAETGFNLFPAQYIHARCCNLLSLAEREKLFIFNESADSISWLDENCNLWIDGESELILLRQLFFITDSFIDEHKKWHKLALDFSQAIAIFLAECRFLGEIRQQTPQKAIARLGLIALSQYWLQRILVEKLHVTAPTSL